MEEIIDSKNREEQFQAEDKALISTLPAPIVFDQESKTKYDQLVSETALKFAVSVKTADDFRASSEEIAEMKGKRKERTNYWEDLKEAANKIHKDVCLREKKQIFPYDVLILSREKGVNVYLLEQDRLRREAQDKAEAEARAKEEAARAEMIAEAANAAAEGNLQDAQDFVEQAQDYKVEPEKVAPPAPTTVKSSAGTTSWGSDIEVTHWDTLAVIAAVMEGTFPLECVDIKDNVLKSFFNKKYITEYHANGVTVKIVFGNRVR